MTEAETRTEQPEAGEVTSTKRFEWGGEVTRPETMASVFEQIITKGGYLDAAFAAMPDLAPHKDRVELFVKHYVCHYAGHFFAQSIRQIIEKDRRERPTRKGDTYYVTVNPPADQKAPTRKVTKVTHDERGRIASAVTEEIPDESKQEAAAA